MSTLKLPTVTLPPTASGAASAGRVSSIVTGWTAAAVASVRWPSGWKDHASKRQSRMTPVVNSRPAPTRTGWSASRYGSGFWLPGERMKFVVAPSSRTISCCALAAATACASAPGSATDVGLSSGVVPGTMPREPYWLRE